MDPIDTRLILIQTALGRIPLDLVVRNVRLLNVYTGAIESACLGIKAGRIVTIDASGLDSAETVDAGGRYALPGFIDSHVHLDSSLLTPENLAGLIVPHGTTVMLADPMESANVGGLAGLQALLTGADELPYHLWIEVSSRVPTAPGLETTGGELGLEDVRRILQEPTCISLGELDPSKVLGLLPEYLAKVEAAHAAGKIANGHAAGLSGRELDAYVCGGLSDDHEAVDWAETHARLRVGLPVFVREGSTERNLEPILRGLLAERAAGRPGDTHNLMFCTDDKHPDDVLAEGHIDYMVRRAIQMGLPVMEAVRMATLNAAQHFRLEGQVGSLAPGRWADILLLDDLEAMHIEEVYVRGRLAVRDGKLVGGVPSISYPDWFHHTVKTLRGRSAVDFRLAAPRGAGKRAHVRVIELYPDQIINRRGEAFLPVCDGALDSDITQDVLKLSVVERYGKNGNIGTAFVRGFGLQRGALASSVAHDHHNIIVAGVDDESMAACVRAIEDAQGGLAVAAGGEVLGLLPLPLGGLMSSRPASEVIRELGTLNQITRSLGGALPAPFMTISFIGLPTVPEYGLTDKGLVDVRRHELIDLFL